MAILKKSLLWAAAVGAVLWSGCNWNNQTPVKPESEKMMYIAFPKSPGSPLKRAIFLTGRELYDDEKFNYFDGDEKKNIPRGEVTLRPPASEEELDRYIVGFNAEIARWGKNTDFKRLEYHRREDRTYLRMHLKSGKIIGFDYVVKQDLAPERCRIVTVF